MNAAALFDHETGVTPEIASLLHDIRNPLAAIRSSAEMLLYAEMPETQVRRLARNMHAASVRIQELLDDFLSRRNGIAGNVELCNIRELISGAVEKVAPAAELQAVQILQKAPEDLVVRLDRGRIRQVLVNLLVNALEAMPDGGTICISATPQARSVVIEVRDSGPGISPELRGRLFQPFATAGKERGLGLGLAISRQAVVEHGGEMWAESSREGACFAVRLSANPQVAGCASC